MAFIDPAGIDVSVGLGAPKCDAAIPPASLTLSASLGAPRIGNADAFNSPITAEPVAANLKTKAAVAANATSAELA